METIFGINLLVKGDEFLMHELKWNGLPTVRLLH